MPAPLKLRVQFRLRISKGSDIAVGPGKVDLLEAIAKTGSITSENTGNRRWRRSACGRA
jgi:molybdate transport system regulatory protein